MISILLLAALLLAHGYVVGDALTTLPDAALATAMPPVSVQAFAALDTPVSPVLSLGGYAGTQNVTAYYTTADAPALFGLTMQHGGFTSWEEGDIIIGSELAVALFLREDAVGQTISFNGRACTVRGVYAQPDSLLARMSQTPATYVFLPLAAYPDQNAMASEVLVGLADAPSTASVTVGLESQLGVRLTFHSAYHFGETRRLAQQSGEILGLLLALAFCVLSAWWAVRLVQRLVKDAKEGVERRAVLCCAAAVVCFVAGAIWLSQSTFTLFLPLDFILREGGIVAYVVGNVQLVNLKSNVFLCAFSLNVKGVLAVLDVCVVVILLKIVYQVKSAIGHSQNVA